MEVLKSQQPRELCCPGQDSGDSKQWEGAAISLQSNWAAGHPIPAESPVPAIVIPEQQKEHCSWICLLGKGFALTVGRSFVSAQESTSLWGWRAFCPLGLWEARALCGAQGGETKAGPPLLGATVGSWGTTACI